MATSASRRRLAKDHAELHSSLPPDYFFPTPLTTSTYSLSTSADLTNLTIHLLGPASTPFSSGIFTLTLTLPPSYPTNPPTARFHTKIFHPNVDERTGDVCVDTLKRDWTPQTTLKDVLLTIRCLLIYPNPESSLNETAGKMLREDYGGFERHAKLMTDVHANVPKALKELVEEVRTRNEEIGSISPKDKGKKKDDLKPRSSSPKPSKTADFAEPAESSSKPKKKKSVEFKEPPVEPLTNSGKENAYASSSSSSSSTPTITVTATTRPPTPSTKPASSSLGKRPISDLRDNLPATESRKAVKLTRDALASKLAETRLADSVLGSSSSLPGTLRIGERDLLDETEETSRKYEGVDVIERPKRKDSLQVARPVVRRAVSAAERKQKVEKARLKRF
ncbi:UBC-like protein [Ascobolus immersus RN42]|uniref:Ubiquitin-conjugating enzyme E2 2 n=1 Tax=Ascobolus immersus RN42 TaxID=1160509 RepID=A0A3N4IFG6_ASCIM|nr:UBC-like protein [Ascobolus immersus RN42]